MLYLINSVIAMETYDTSIHTRHETAQIDLLIDSLAKHYDQIMQGIYDNKELGKIIYKKYDSYFPPVVRFTDQKSRHQIEALIRYFNDCIQKINFSNQYSKIEKKCLSCLQAMLDDKFTIMPDRQSEQRYIYIKLNDSYELLKESTKNEHSYVRFKNAYNDPRYITIENNYYIIQHEQILQNIICIDKLRQHDPQCYEYKISRINLLQDIFNNVHKTYHGPSVLPSEKKKIVLKRLLHTKKKIENQFKLGKNMYNLVRNKLLLERIITRYNK